MSFWHGEHELHATAFPKDRSVRQGGVVENKRLSATMDFIKEKQRQRTEAKIAKPSTTLRDARLLRAGTPAPDRNECVLRDSTLTHGKGKSGHFYFGENRTSVLWADRRDRLEFLSARGSPVVNQAESEGIRPHIGLRLTLTQPHLG